MKKRFSLIFEACYADEFNRLTILLALGGSLIAYLIWSKLSSYDTFNFYTPYSYYPLEMLAAIIILHMIIIVYSYKLDKYISYLLSSALTFYALLIIILEFYYWANL